MLLLLGIASVGHTAAQTTVNYVAREDAHSGLICRYLNAAQVGGARREAAMEVTIQARLEKLNRQATIRALRNISPAGKITYDTLEAAGDGMVRREVIARYLTAESDASEINEIAITSAHYKFRFSRTIDDAGRVIHVFQLSPRFRRVGLFKGELWLDSQSGLPVHESGQFVKNPSVFVKHIVFVRDYEIRNGMAVPQQITSTVDTRLVGRADLTIRFGDFIQNEAQHRTGEVERECP